MLAQLGAAQAYAQRAEVIRRTLGAAAVAAYERMDDVSAIDGFLDQMVPMSLAAQQALALSLLGYLSAVTGERAVLDLDAVTGDAVRPEGMRHSWSIPFFTLYAALGAGVAFAEGYARARADVETQARTDLAFAQSATMSALGGDLEQVTGYRRVVAGAGCEFCAEASASRYRAGDLMPLHPGCVCSVAPILGSDDPGRRLNAAALGD